MEKIGQEFYHSQLFGSPVGLVMGQETSIEDATEVEPEARCKSCECEIFTGCNICPYCGIKNPLELPQQQVEGIQQAGFESLKQTIEEFKNYY